MANNKYFHDINIEFLEESDNYTLTPSDIGHWVTLKLLNPTLVSAGTAYLAAVKGYQHPTDTSLISSSRASMGSCT